MDRYVYIVKEDNTELAVCMTLEVALMLVDARFNSYGSACGSISITKKVQEKENGTT